MIWEREGNRPLNSCKRSIIAVRRFNLSPSRVISEQRKKPIDLGGKWEATIIQLITQYWMPLCRCESNSNTCSAVTLSQWVVQLSLTSPASKNIRWVHFTTKYFYTSALININCPGWNRRALLPLLALHQGEAELHHGPNQHMRSTAAIPAVMEEFLLCYGF